MYFLEIDHVLRSRDSEVLKMSDRNETPFLLATIGEIQRCANLLPVNLQHRVIKDTVIQGHSIPSGTSILPQLANVLIDERFFPEAERFNPDRFLNVDGKTQKNLEFVVPFSLGKRSCMGESLAKMELFLALGTLIQKFRFSASQGLPSVVSVPGFIRSPKPFDMTFAARL